MDEIEEDTWRQELEAACCYCQHQEAELEQRGQE